MARLTGGPTTVFISGRLATMRGLARSLMSMIETVSWPGGLLICLPAASQVCFSSLPLRMSCACAPHDSGGPAVIARSASRDKPFMISSLFSWAPCRRQFATGSAAAPHPTVAPTLHCGTAHGAACYAQGQAGRRMIEAAETALRDGRTHWRRETAARVAFLVDGEAYFAAFRPACLAARHVI